MKIKINFMNYYELLWIQYDIIEFQAGRPGSCSKIGSAVGSICIDECTSDYNCPIGEKCCNSGCGRICTKPIGGGDGEF
jgi:hypothetical protein